MAILGMTARSSADLPSSCRVVVDDRFSEHWCLAARRTAPDWFGDFSTYNFASATEWLGLYHSVAVNVGRAYSTKMLDEYDVLLLKIPTREMPSSELQAIRGFVKSGGGVVCIGDHTDLLRSSEFLNQITAEAGIRFRFDAVSSAETGGFSRWSGASRHPALQGVSKITFMTGCSLDVSGGAQPLMVCSSQSRTLGDYSQSSHFGALRSDPATGVGPVCLAAASQLGAGRVVAIADSTMFSSFGVFKEDRLQLLDSTIRWAGAAEVGDGSGVGGLAAVVCGAAATAFSLLILGLGFWRYAAMGLIVGGFVHVFVPPTGSEGRLGGREPTVWIDDQYAGVAFPPVLGTPANLRAEWMYDTFLSCWPRHGVRPILMGSPTPGAKIGVTLAPYRQRSQVDLDELSAWVAAGRVLIVGVRDDYEDHGAVAQLREAFDGPATERVIEGGGFGSQLRVQHGAGMVVFVDGIEAWSRDGMGHCFSRPGATWRRNIGVLYDLIEELGPEVGSRRTYAILE